MNYDLTQKEERRKFVKRANELLKKQRANVALSDESNRTLNQNSYIHVLCRILASQTGVSESYAKQVYFKELSNSDIFISVTQDPVTEQMVKFTRSTKDLTIPEMRHAITNFRDWAAEQGYYLPEATLNDDGTMSFSSETEKQAYNQAAITTSKFEDYM